MNRIAAFLAATLFSFPAAAQQASDATVEQLMKVTRAEAMVQTMMGAIDQIMGTAMKEATKDQPLSPEQQRKVDATSAKIREAMRDEMSWERLKPQYMSLYRETFTEEEVRGLIAFYESPAGVALLSKMPLLMQKSVALSQERMKSMIPRMKAAVEEAVVQAKAGH
jgi:hypothetical protein